MRRRRSAVVLVAALLWSACGADEDAAGLAQVDPGERPDGLSRDSAGVVDTSVVGDSVVGDSVVGDSVVGDSVLGDSVVGDSVVGDSVVGDSVLGDSVLGDSVLDDSVVGDSVLGDSVLDDSVVGDSVPDTSISSDIPTTTEVAPTDTTQDTGGPEVTPLADGAKCVEDAQCRSLHCDNGVCCGAGTCCDSIDDCAYLNDEPRCDDVATCAGSRVVGICSSSFACELANLPAPEACAGQRCAPGECKNLELGSLILEGLERHTCSALGACEPEVVDCRVPDVTSYCTDDSDFYLCEGCTPKREACVVFGSPCFCHD
ncbi:MAG: hypothetical protein IT385_24365 [Deltaproteobacteria bacterium]|nr:hypothetical protein [Deltaproteobacteria bacterium]